MGLQVGVYYSYPPSLHNHQSPSQGGKLSKYSDVFVNLDTIAAMLSNHNKVIHDSLLIDADTLDTEHAAAIVTNARVKAHFPALITDILSDHSQAVHNALNIDADTVDSKHLPGVIADILSDHSQAVHNALNIDADKVDGEEAAAIVTNARVKAYFPDTIANVLSNHTKAVHDALALDHASLGNVLEPQHHAKGHSHQDAAQGGKLDRYGNTFNVKDTIANILTDHTKAIHDALALDHASLGNIQIADHHAKSHSHQSAAEGGKLDKYGTVFLNLDTIAAILSNHSQAIHNALNIDAETVDGIHLPAQYTQVLEAVSCVKAYRNSNQSIPNDALTIIVFNAETYDNLNAFNTGTGQFVVPAGHAGKYFVKSSIYMSMSSASARLELNIYKDAGQKAVTLNWTEGVTPQSVQVSSVLNLAVGDIITIRIKHTNGSAVNTGSDVGSCYVAIHRLL